MSLVLVSLMVHLQHVPLTKRIYIKSHNCIKKKIINIMFDMFFYWFSFQVDSPLCIKDFCYNFNNNNNTHKNWLSQLWYLLNPILLIILIVWYFISGASTIYCLWMLVFLYHLLTDNRVCGLIYEHIWASFMWSTFYNYFCVCVDICML